MKLNKKVIFKLLVIFTMILVFLISKDVLPTFNNANSHNMTNIEGIDQSEEIEESEEVIDLYEIYYSLSSIKILNNLSANEITEMENKLSKFDLEKLLNEENINISLYDIWLYTKTIELIDSRLNFKEEVLSYLDSLSSDKGFYLSSNLENTEQDAISYLISTKMVLEIYEAYGEPIPQANRTKNWVLNLCEKLLNSGEQDFVSLGDHIVMINEIGNLLYHYNKEDIFKEKKYIRLSKKVDDLLKIDFKNIQEYSTLIDLSRTYGINTKYISGDFESYMKSVQLGDGSFPLYGDQNQPSDILTTYLFIKTSNELGLTIPNYDQLHSYLSEKLTN